MKKKNLFALFLMCAVLIASLAGCGSKDGEQSTGGEAEETSSGEYTHRVILISDTHYMSNMSKAEYQAMYPESNPSAAFGDAFGYTQTEKMAAILEDVDTFTKREDVDGILVLGDLSTDDYGYANLPENYVQKFKDEVMEKFPCESWAIPGNHDSYPNDMWNEIFGYDRQYSVKIGDAAFIMLDTYQSGLAPSATGADYTGVDVEWLEEEIKKYPTEQIFLVGHYFDPNKSDYSFSKLLKENDRIVCMFMGHSHANELLLPEGYANRFLVNVYGYAYKSEKLADGTWHFDYFDEDYAWGFGVLEWNDTEANYYHVKFGRTYVGRNGTFDYAGGIHDQVTFKFKK